jgi:hypothetical protein
MYFKRWKRGVSIKFCFRTDVVIPLALSVMMISVQRSCKEGDLENVVGG